MYTLGTARCRRGSRHEAPNIDKTRFNLPSNSNSEKKVSEDWNCNTCTRRLDFEKLKFCFPTFPVGDRRDQQTRINDRTYDTCWARAKR